MKQKPSFGKAEIAVCKHENGHPYDGGWQCEDCGEWIPDNDCMEEGE